MPEKKERRRVGRWSEEETRALIGYVSQVCLWRVDGTDATHTYIKTTTTTGGQGTVEGDIVGGTKAGALYQPLASGFERQVEV